MKNKSRETSLQYDKHDLDLLVQISVNMPNFHRPYLSGNSSNSADWSIITSLSRDIAKTWVLYCSSAREI